MKDTTLNKLWEIITEQLEKNKDPYAHINAVYEFNITDQEDYLYQIAFQDGTAIIYDSSEKEPDCTLSMKEADFKKLLLGKLNSTMAFMTGKLKVKGNMNLALTLEKMLKKYDFSNE